MTPHKPFLALAWRLLFIGCILIFFYDTMQGGVLLATKISLPTLFPWWVLFPACAVVIADPAMRRKLAVAK
jgi:hypothetical protein